MEKGVNIMDDLKKNVISVIVPVYNAESTVARCIESIISQEFSDFELIMVDDGSTDNSLKICRRFERIDKRIRVFSQQNSGVSKARNVGLSNATGEWCVFVDSDDWCEKNHLQKLMNQNTDITYIGYRMYDEEQNELFCRTVPAFYADGTDFQIGLSKLIDEKNFFAIIWTKKFKMEIIKKYNICFDEQVCISEDILFTHEFLHHANSISVIEDATYNYTLRKGSLSHGGTKPLNEIMFLEKYALLISKLSYSAEIIDKLEKSVRNRADNLICYSFRIFSKADLTTKKAMKRFVRKETKYTSVGNRKCKNWGGLGAV